MSAYVLQDVHEAGELLAGEVDRRAVHERAGRAHAVGEGRA